MPRGAAAAAAATTSSSGILSKSIQQELTLCGGSMASTSSLHVGPNAGMRQ